MSIVPKGESLSHLRIPTVATPLTSVPAPQRIHILRFRKTSKGLGRPPQACPKTNVVLTTPAFLESIGVVPNQAEIHRRRTNGMVVVW
jgi:hypothetical protein